jgi:3-oxoacyl-[acyl-carrier protein] reductase
MSDFDGLTAVVTGGASGIGLATAELLAARGASVAVLDMNVADLPAGLHGVRADVTDDHEVRVAITAAAEHLGGIDVLVNNAGVFVAHPITGVSYEDWQQAWQDTLGVNLVGAANVTWCAVRHMPTGGGGRIVNVSSRGAFRGEPGQPAYGASKAGLISFGQSLARDLGGRGIAVTTVAPGFTETDMAAETLAGPDGDRRRAESPMGRVATPREVAQAVFYLASAQAEFATGTVLDMNGASYLRM